jgi:capsular exopolysaccharide synthesis family protein
MEPKDYSEEIDFQKYWLVLKRRWFPTTLVFSATIALTTLYTSLQIPVYQATGKLLFRSDRTSSLTGLESNLGKAETFNRDSDPLANQSEIIVSLPVAEAVVKTLDLRNEKGELVDPKMIASGLDTKTVSGTDIIQIYYKSTDPELAAAVVNATMKAYMENNVQRNRAEAVAAREFILQQLPQTELAVGKAEEELRRFKEQNGIVILEDEASAAVSAIANLDKQLTDAQAQLAEVSARSAELRRRVGMDPDSSIDISALNQSEGVQDALRELQKVQADLASERARYQSRHPTITQLERRETELQALLQERVSQVLGSNQQVSVGALQIGQLRQELIENLVQTEIQRLGLVRRINDLSRSQSIYIQRSTVLPGLEKTQRELERRLTAAQTTYETLLTQLQEVQVAENQNIGTASVITDAVVPGNPIEPNQMVNLIAGGFVGILLGITTAFLLDLADRSVKTLKEAKDLFKYTLLGIIPDVSKLQKAIASADDSDPRIPKVFARDFPDSAVQEAYHMLRANLKFVSSDKELKTIVITSSVRQEGRSEVAANLAAAIAQVKRRVLLVDADIRHPIQHHIWNLASVAGLSNLIVGEVKVGDVIKVVSPTLHVLPAGVIPPNPLALLDSGRMASIVKAFSQKYDFVIFDTPALSGTADASVLGKMTDGVLLVVRPGVVDSGNGAAAQTFLNQSNQNVLGMVVNGVNAKGEPDSYFYYTQKEQFLPKSGKSNDDAVEALSQS